jgi:putative ABC transport system permease protein
MLKIPPLHLQYSFFIPLRSIGIPAKRMESWGWQQFYTYVKVKKGTDARLLEKNFQELAQEGAAAANKEKKSANKPAFQALQDIHLYSSDFKFDGAVRGNITYVKALSIIAVFVLLIACFNFINLATAKSLQRAKEVGVRKSIGAGRKQLILQFTGETILLSIISILLAVGIALVTLPWLNSFTNKHIPFGLFINPVMLLLLSGLALLVGILAGFYPALVLSGFRPVKVLKGVIPGSEQPGKIPWLRHGLVVTQFTLSVLLIISALVVFRQVDYLHNKDMGFNKEQIMFFPLRGDNMNKNYEAFKKELLQSNGVSSVSIGYGFPGDAVAGDGIVVPHIDNKKERHCTQLMVDYDYIKTLDIHVIAGRGFSKEMSTDKDHAFMLNETAVRELGFGTPEKALGQNLAWHPWGARNPDSLKTGQIIGVVKDFNYKSLYDKVETTVLQIFPDANFKVAVKIKSAGLSKVISHVQTTWNKFSPEYPLEYKFLDDNFEQMYNSEDKLTSLLWIFTGMAVFVGCLGLLGLAAYTAERRRKEVSIRKVLGASVQGMVFLLSKDFIKLVMISLLIASPIAWYFMHQWLTDFAYRIDISWWIFVLTAAIAIGIAFLTVSFQAIKAATGNPVKSLRAE